MRNKHQQLCFHLGIEQKYHQQLKLALTHFSFYKENEEELGSRFVFLGQTAFKGEVAQQLFTYQSGKGTQLQHTLGNLFKNKHLETIFDKYDLQYIIRYKNGFDWEKHKHIFTYAMLGFLCKFSSKENLNEKIHLLFLNQIEDNYLHKQKNKDYKGQVIYLCKQLELTKPTLTINETNEGYTASISILDFHNITTGSSSYKYVQKKAWKQMLRFISEQLELALLQDEEYIKRTEEREQKRQLEISKENEKKLTAYFEKRQNRSNEIRQRKQQLKDEAQERDRKRRESKQRRKEREKMRAKASLIDLSTISAAKRRILEDRGILPKRK